MSAVCVRSCIKDCSKVKRGPSIMSFDPHS
uniref:Uncharacterized protein n=1 Tax=Arundo donax TaxID=35708 RepID=A0A0A9AAF9_ARUDO